MVEHNLAKVGVASSSLVFRSMLAQVAELVDAHVSGACVERRAGSTPVLGTKAKGPIFFSECRTFIFMWFSVYVRSLHLLCVRALCLFLSTLPLFAR